MKGFRENYQQLNAAQKQAVDTIEGPVLVIAGPGTGKTQLLSMRVANILAKTDANPENILCLTFTEAAARNMRERLAGMIGEAAYHVAIHTFHSFGTDIIGRYSEYFLDRPLLKPVDELGAYELLASIFSNLPARNPLHISINGDFFHLRSTQAVISWLKQAGLEPDNLRHNLKINKSFIDYANPKFETVFAERPSPKLLHAYSQLLADLKAYASKEESSLQEILVLELEDAINQVDPSSRYAKSITTWRNKWLVQRQEKQWVLSDLRRNRIMQALASVYDRFQRALADRGWFTFDDMILRTINALETSEELRLTLQEQYQYVLVDEYQDTNGAQNKLLELLADNPVHENRPNLMVVGDDDQAIYRFQGAHLSIMSEFVEKWRDVSQIVLTENYRSNQKLLELARHIITQGNERLENTLPNISKELTAARKNIKPSVILRPQTVSEIDQYSYVAHEISQLIKKGAEPSSIAVLAPKHSYLQALVPYLLDQKIPVTYERREHILEQPRIVELINLARLVVLAAEGKWHEVDAALSEALAADYWQIPPRTLWQLSIAAYKNKQTWMELMANHNNRTLANLAQALPIITKQAKVQPLEVMLDILLGNVAIDLDKDKSWKIPYRQTYFNDAALEKDPVAYFTLLGQLTTLRETLREYRPGEQLTLSDFIHFVDLYRQSSLTLLDTNPHSITDNAVELMTAYKAKGLEWDTVFILGCHNDIWGTAVRSSNYSISLPHDLAWIKPARDSIDDRLRLFYVALTRARQNLYLTCYKQTLSGKATAPVSWLLNEHPSIPQITEPPRPTTKELVHSQELHWGLSTKEQADLRTTLKPFLERYQLSATHINDFLDITKGGPKNFFFAHILHFPQRLAPSAVFGSAIHQSLHYMHTYMNSHKQLPTLTDVLKTLKRQFTNSPFTPEETRQLEERGEAALTYFYKHMGKSIQPTDKSEYNFAHEGSHFEKARLSGRVDVMRKNEANELEIIDYKTGRPFSSWKPKGPYPQIRAHLYQQQLNFYHLLVSSSANYSTKPLSDKAYIQFVESDEDGALPRLEYQFTPEETERTQRLILSIWEHIMLLDFPDTSNYSLDLKGIKQFEEDLLKGTI